MPTSEGTLLAGWLRRNASLTQVLGVTMYSPQCVDTKVPLISGETIWCSNAVHRRPGAQQDHDRVFDYSDQARDKDDTNRHWTKATKEKETGLQRVRAELFVHRWLCRANSIAVSFGQLHFWIRQSTFCNNPEDRSYSWCHFAGVYWVQRDLPIWYNLEEIQRFLGAFGDEVMREKIARSCHTDSCQHRCVIHSRAVVHFRRSRTVNTLRTNHSHPDVPLVGRNFNHIESFAQEVHDPRRNCPHGALHSLFQRANCRVDCRQGIVRIELVAAAPNHESTQKDFDCLPSWRETQREVLRYSCNIAVPSTQWSRSSKWLHTTHNVSLTVTSHT